MTKISLSKDRRAFLNGLVNESIRIYRASGRERGMLHDMEWNDSRQKTNSDAALLLGTGESFSSDIAAIAISLSKSLTIDAEWAMSVLEKASLLKCPDVSSWLIQEAEQFPRYAAYIHFVEFLRMTLLAEIRDACHIEETDSVRSTS